LIKNNSNSWSNLAILAHEIGHHVNGHSLDLLLYGLGKKNDQTLEKKRKQELEADEYSGFVMHKLGATLEQAQSAVKLISSNSDDTYSTHPNKSKRLSAIEKGFNMSRSSTKVKKVSLSENSYIIETYENGKIINEKTYINEKLAKENKIIGVQGSKDLWQLSDYRHGFGGKRISGIPHSIRNCVLVGEKEEIFPIGSSKIFYENGILKEESYYDEKSNILSGKRYYDNGNIEQEEGYLNNEVVWMKCYLRNGELIPCN